MNQPWYRPVGCSRVERSDGRTDRHSALRNAGSWEGHLHQMCYLFLGDAERWAGCQARSQWMNARNGLKTAASRLPQQHRLNVEQNRLLKDGQPADVRRYGASLNMPPRDAKWTKPNPNRTEPVRFPNWWWLPFEHCITRVMKLSLFCTEFAFQQVSI